jgi:type IV pilus assembly protein PilZ
VPDNSRVHPRAPIELKVAYQRMNAFLADFTRDISKGGVFIQTATPLPVGTEFTFHISLPKRPDAIRLHGRVIRVDNTGMGIQFVWTADEERDRFEKLVEALMVESLGEDLYRKLLERGHV